MDSFGLDAPASLPDLVRFYLEWVQGPATNRITGETERLFISCSTARFTTLLFGKFCAIIFSVVLPEPVRSMVEQCS
jgi:hypothetical protein